MAGEFLELMGFDVATRARVTTRVIDVIGASFVEDQSRQTMSETRRRFAIVERLIRELRADHGWAIERILDALPVALRSKLDGGNWTPDGSRTVWSPTPIVRV